MNKRGLTTAVTLAGDESAAMMARTATAPTLRLRVEVELERLAADFFLHPPQGKFALRVVPFGQVAHCKVDMLMVQLPDSRVRGWMRLDCSRLFL